MDWVVNSVSVNGHGRLHACQTPHHGRRKPCCFYEQAVAAQSSNAPQAHLFGMLPVVGSAPVAATPLGRRCLTNDPDNTDDRVA
jgi:hypothetical protein